MISLSKKTRISQKKHIFLGMSQLALRIKFINQGISVDTSRYQWISVIPGDTRYKGIPGDIRGYQGIPGHTREYQRIPGDKKGYQEIQGVTRGYMGIRIQIRIRIRRRGSRSGQKIRTSEQNQDQDPDLLRG